MHRNISKTLNVWATSSGRKPLLLRGARQVGKTWSVRELGKTFNNFVEFNLEAQPELHRHFDHAFGKPEVLRKLLEAEANDRIDEGATLLFIDEIQECSNAILSLRYFKEKMPNLHVIAAGSLVEFTLKNLSFPVGRIETMHIFPMTFAEYLTAKNLLHVRDQLLGETNARVRMTLHDKLILELQTFMLIGGMPEVVATYLQSESLDKAQNIQQQLVTNFRLDFNKYASRAKIPYVRKIFDEAPRSLGRKFVYAHIAPDIRARELGGGVELLEEAGVITRAFHTSGNGVPLSAEAHRSKFKVFFVDIGLCNRLLGLRLSHELALRPHLIVNRGGLAEQFVAQELIATTDPNALPELHYWHREEKSAQAEVDFLVEHDQLILPIEVKSGQSSKTKSLRIFMQEKSIRRGMLLSEAPLLLGESVERIPLYLIDQLRSYPIQKNT